MLLLLLLLHLLVLRGVRLLRRERRVVVGVVRGRGRHLVRLRQRRVGAQVGVVVPTPGAGRRLLVVGLVHGGRRGHGRQVAVLPRAPRVGPQPPAQPLPLVQQAGLHVGLQHHHLGGVLVADAEVARAHVVAGAGVPVRVPGVEGGVENGEAGGSYRGGKKIGR